MGRKEQSEMLLHKKGGKICLCVVGTPNEYYERFRSQNLEIKKEVTRSSLLPVLSGVSDPFFPQDTLRAY